MSLDFHTADGVPSEEHFEPAHWTYTGFGRFRRRVAAQIGMDLYAMVGFGGTINWDEWESHPLYPLLNHSDCDGSLEPQECGRIVPALWEIIRDWPASDYDTIQARRLIDHMAFCVTADKALIFG